ncbi:hypothetical protein Poly51_28860 [Rubripirellula tenax]|uniref:Uncharacterized protein n=1 Tax=Rubripirellula tenax TaxID=2528015 RepID=A0A5C6F9X3_9BACT|nr:hypothetical protein [Rubripirellula tenax]TWU56966.1 hypothetical protein Poly51_28860 [Rubripirellula tenax]
MRKSKLLCAAMICVSVMCQQTSTADDVVTSVELFAAIDTQTVEATFIPADSTEARVVLKNLTDAPIALRLPAAVAAVPVLAQFGNGQGQGGQQGAGGGQGGQSVGGGVQGQGGGPGQGFAQGAGQQGGQVGGFMRIPPGKTMRMKLTTVCLEHGKPEPNPRMAYRLVPLEQVTDQSAIAVLCEKLAAGDVSQRVAQAVAWHLIDGMGWQTLAAKNQVESKYLGEIKFFTAKELTEAKSLAIKLQGQTLTATDSYNQHSVDR